jgi:hypothetical protein
MLYVWFSATTWRNFVGSFVRAGIVPSGIGGGEKLMSRAALERVELAQQVLLEEMDEDLTLEYCPPLPSPAKSSTDLEISRAWKSGSDIRLKVVTIIRNWKVKSEQQ